MVDLSKNLEDIKDILHEKILSINGAIRRMADGRDKDYLIARRNKIQDLLDVVKNGIDNDNNYLVMLTLNELQDLQSRGVLK